MKAKFFKLIILILTHSYCFMSCTNVDNPIHNKVVLNDGWQVQAAEQVMSDGQTRSEERRVGEEC